MITPDGCPRFRAAILLTLLPALLIGARMASGAVIPHVRSDVGFAFGPYENPEETRQRMVVFEVLAGDPDAVWIRVHFDKFRLNPLDFVRITDNAGNFYDVQGRQVDRTAGPLGLGEYTSLFFNGSRLQIELFAEPGSFDEGINVDYIHYGEAPADGGDAWNCLGPSDAGTDDRVGRLIVRKVHEVTGDVRYQVCSATALFPGDCILTDGDCMECVVGGYCVDPNDGGSAIVQFDVPASLADPHTGAIQHPLPSDQFRLRSTPAPCLDPTDSGGDFGRDYAVFVVAPNEKTGFSHASAFSERRLIPPEADKAVVVEGFHERESIENHLQFVDQEAQLLSHLTSVISAINGNAGDGSEGSAVRSVDGVELYGIANEPVCNDPAIDPQPLEIEVTTFNEPGIDPDNDASCTNRLCNSEHGFAAFPGLRPRCVEFDNGAFVLVPCDGEAKFGASLILPGAQVDLDLAGFLDELRGAPILRFDDRLEIDLQLMQFDFEGVTCVGPVRIRLQPGRQTLGRTTQSTPSALYPADSYFDVFLEIDVNGTLLHNETPMHLAASIHAVPAYGETYFGPTGAVMLLDAQNVEVASLSNVWLTTETSRERHSAVIQLDTSPFGSLTAFGTVDRKRGAIAWDTTSRMWKMPVETAAMELRGSDPTLGPFVVRESASRGSLGQLLFEGEPSANPPFPVQGAFDVFYEIELVQVGQTLVTLEPFRLQGSLDDFPPTGSLLTGQSSLTLYDQQSGQAVGTLFGVGEFVQDPIAWTAAPAAGDVRYCTTAQLVVDLGQGPVTLSALEGSAVVRRELALDQVDGLDRVPMELVSLSLHGDSSPLGPISLGLDPLRTTHGAMQQTEQGTFYPASSSFDVFLAIGTTQGTLRNLQPFRVERLEPRPEPAEPEPEPYSGLVTGVQLVDAAACHADLC